MDEDPFEEARRMISRALREARQRDRDRAARLGEAAARRVGLSEARRATASMHASHDRAMRAVLAALAAARRRRRGEGEDPAAGAPGPSPRPPRPRRPGGGIEPALVRPDRPNILSGGAEAPLDP